MRVRPATHEDIEAFSNLRNKPSLLAWAGEVDGKIVALGGLAFSGGRWFAFCDVTDEARKHKVALARAAIRVFEQARKQNIRFIYAQADPAESNSVRWLASLGFEHDPRTASLYRWKS